MTIHENFVHMDNDILTYKVKYSNYHSEIIIIKGFRTIVFIFIVISTTFRPLCPPAFFRCLSNSGTFTELRTTSFIESTGVACSDSVSHNRVQVGFFFYLCSYSEKNLNMSTGKKSYIIVLILVK